MWSHNHLGCDSLGLEGSGVALGGLNGAGQSQRSRFRLKKYPELQMWLFDLFNFFLPI